MLVAVAAARYGRVMPMIRSSLVMTMIVITAVFAWAHHNARIDPIVHRARIGFRDWPAAAPRVRVALMSDVHLGNEAMDAARLRRIVRQIDALDPDLILLAGDYIAGHRAAVARKFAPQLIGPLSELHAPLGVVAVMGNHDYDTNPRLIQRALHAAGITVLTNQATARGALTIAGFDDLFHGRADVPATLAAARKLPGIDVALSHGSVRGGLGGAITVQLVGHTHCGQVELKPFGLSNPFTRTNYPCGILPSEKGVTLVTAGVGTSIVPFRVNAPPDLWLLTLGPAAR
jgi:hypothetical protein